MFEPMGETLVDRVRMLVSLMVGYRKETSAWWRVELASRRLQQIDGVVYG